MIALKHKISWYPTPNNWHIKIKCLDCGIPFLRHIHHPKPLLWVKTMAEFWTPSLLTLSSRWSVLILKSTPVGLHYWRLFDGEVVQRKLWGKLGGQNSFKFTYSGDVGVGKVVLRVSKQQWRLAHPRVSDQQHLYCLKFKHQGSRPIPPQENNEEVTLREIPIPTPTPPHPLLFGANPTKSLKIIVLFVICPNIIVAWQHLEEIVKLLLL